MLRVVVNGTKFILNFHFHLKNTHGEIQMELFHRKRKRISFSISTCVYFSSENEQFGKSLATFTSKGPEGEILSSDVNASPFATTGLPDWPFHRPIAVFDQSSAVVL